MPATTKPAEVPTLRAPIPSDEGFLLALTERLAAFPVPGWRSRDEIARADHAILLDAFRRPSPENLIMIAEYPAGRPAGYIFATTKIDYFTDRPHGHIEILVVTPEAEGHGIARALLAAADDWAGQRGYDLITLNVFSQNQAARAVYDRLGYEAELVRYRKDVRPRSQSSSR